MMRAEMALAAPGTNSARRAATHAAIRSRKDAMGAVTPESYCVPVILVFPSYCSFFAQRRDLIFVISQSAEPDSCVLGELGRWSGRNGRFAVELKACTGHVLGVGRCVGGPVGRGEVGDELALGKMGMLQN